MNPATVLEHENCPLTLPNDSDNHMVTADNDNTVKTIIVQVAPDEQSPLLQNSRSDDKSLSMAHHQHYQASNNNNNNKPGIIKTNSSGLGFGLIAFATVIFAYLGVIVRFCSAVFPAFQILFVRSIIQSVCGISSCVYLGVNPFGPRHVRPWLVLHGLAAGFAIAASYYAITHLSFSDATVILYLNAALTTLLAAVFLSEPFHYCQGICVTLCFVGAAFVTKPRFIFGSVANNNYHDHNQNDNNSRELAIFIAFVGAFLIAIGFCIVRKVGKAVHFLVHASYNGIISTLMCIPPLLTVQSFVWPQFASEYLMLFISGVLAFVGQCFFSKGLQVTPASSAAIINMNGLVLAFLNGIFIFDDRPDGLSILGASIIALTTAVLALRK